METVVQNVNLTLPVADLNFFKELVKKMGWTIEKSKKQSIPNKVTLRAIQDAYNNEAIGVVDSSSYEAFVTSILK